MTPTEVVAGAATRRAMPDAEPEPAPKPEFGQEPSSTPEWCVSYAWGDDTPEGREREAAVDRLCAEAADRGITILRDKTAMGLGERISKFMARIGRGDRVFVVLSDKYLKSPFCMYELSEVWRISRQEEEEFLERIRVFTLPCANIFDLSDRAEYSIYWKNRYEALHNKVCEHGHDILGDRGLRQFRAMRDFYLKTGDILDTVADVLQPRDFEELVRYGFEGQAAGADAE
jgi:internalin A